MNARAPQHLSEPSRKWWRQVESEFFLEPHQVRLLTLAAEAWDRCTQAREILAAEGIVVTDRYKNPRAHPAVAIERDSRAAFAKLIRELALTDDDVGGVGLPRLPRGR